MFFCFGHVVCGLAATGLDESPLPAFALVHGGRVEAESCGLGFGNVFARDVQGADEEGIAVERACFKGFRHIGFPVKKVWVYGEEGVKEDGWHPRPEGSFIVGSHG